MKVKAAHRHILNTLGILAMSASYCPAAVLVEVTQSISEIQDSQDTASPASDRYVVATPAPVNATSASLAGAGDSTNGGYYFSGALTGSGRDTGSLLFGGGNAILNSTQDINASVTWTIEATAGETYSFSIQNSNLAGRLQIIDGGTNAESGVSSNFFLPYAPTVQLTQNGLEVARKDLTPRTHTNRDTVTDFLTDAFNYSVTGLTGTNTFTLRYRWLNEINYKEAELAGNRTTNAVLWGQNTDQVSYGVEASRTSDGLDMIGTVTLDAVPEPATFGLLLIALLPLARRRPRSA